MYNPYADMYDDWMPPCPTEEQAAEEWLEYMRTRKLQGEIRWNTNLKK